MSTGRIASLGSLHRLHSTSRSLSFICEECKLQQALPHRRLFRRSTSAAARSSSNSNSSRSSDESRSGKPLSRTWFAFSPLLSFDRSTSTTSTNSNGRTIGNGVVLSASSPQNGNNDHKQVDERTVNLGKTIDILQTRIPTLLQSPLPSDILSPSITLHLFPTTHPHLPSISGKVGYIAALWTAPVVWGRLPGGKVRLEVLSERVINSNAPGQEKLYVKWRAHSANGNGNGNGNSSGGSFETVNKAQQENVEMDEGGRRDDNDEFSGVFIFEFDDRGRILKHTIENVDRNNHEHSRVISVTEWLMRKVQSRPEDKEAVPSLAFERTRGPPDKRKHGTAAARMNGS